LRFLNNTAIIHSTHDQAGYGLIEMRSPTGNETPRHTHRVESEGFFVLKGELNVRIGDRTVPLGPGQFVLAEPGIPHSLVVTSGDPARWLVVTNGHFDQFVTAVAADQDRNRPVNAGTLISIAARFGIDILNPTSASSTGVGCAVRSGNSTLGVEAVIPGATE
jgi:mannose-6-phosphate isomerase-like protein (cupin superfamily)